MKRDSIHTLVLCALLSAFALALSYIETLFPLPLPVPGARLGLGNALVLLALLTLGPAEAAGVLLTKTALSALLFGKLEVSQYLLAEMRLQQEVAGILRIITDAADIDMGMGQ